MISRDGYDKREMIKLSVYKNKNRKIKRIRKNLENIKRYKIDKYLCDNFYQLIFYIWKVISDESSGNVQG